MVSVVLRLARHKFIFVCHGSCMSLVKKLMVPSMSAQHNVPNVPRSTSTVRHEARKGPVRHGTTQVPMPTATSYTLCLGGLSLLLPSYLHLLHSHHLPLHAQ